MKIDETISMSTISIVCRSVMYEVYYYLNLLKHSQILFVWMVGMLFFVWSALKQCKWMSDMFLAGIICLSEHWEKIITTQSGAKFPCSLRVHKFALWGGEKFRTSASGEKFILGENVIACRLSAPVKVFGKQWSGRISLTWICQGAAEVIYEIFILSLARRAGGNRHTGGWTAVSDFVQFFNEFLEIGNF